MTSLTSLESKVLAAMVANADATTGGEFGILEELKVAGVRGKALGGVITSLQNKNLVTVHEPVETNGGPRRGGERYTQFTIVKESK